MKLYFDKFKQFSKVTEFRLKNAFLVSFGMALLTPIIISLKGIYMLAYIISIFAIIQTLAVKTNNYMVENFSISTLYKIGVIIHLLFILGSLTYFYSPELMIWVDSILGIIEVAVFSAYSIALNNYITDKVPTEMSKFQIIRNGSWADGYLLGLGIITIITYFYDNSIGITAFIVFNTIFSLYLIINWNFFEQDEYCVYCTTKRKEIKWD